MTPGDEWTATESQFGNSQIIANSQLDSVGFLINIILIPKTKKMTEVKMFNRVAAWVSRIFINKITDTSKKKSPITKLNLVNLLNILMI